MEIVKWSTPGNIKDWQEMVAFTDSNFRLILREPCKENSKFELELYEMDGGITGASLGKLEFTEAEALFLLRWINGEERFSFPLIKTQRKLLDTERLNP